MKVFKLLFLALFVFAVGLNAGYKDRLDNFKPTENWPFGDSNSKITQGFLQDATTTKLSPENLKLVVSFGDRFLQDLEIWKAAKTNPEIKNHKNFAAFEKELKNYNEVRKQIADYMQYYFWIPVKTIFIADYKDKPSAIVSDSSGRYYKALSDARMEKLIFFATQVAPLFGGKKDKMGEIIISKVEEIKKANEVSKKLIAKGQAKQKAKEQKEFEQRSKTEKYNPIKKSIENEAKVIKKVRSEFNKGGQIIDITPTSSQKRVDTDAAGLATAKYYAYGQMLVKDNGDFKKYKFMVLMSKNPPTSTTTMFYTKFDFVSKIMPENVDNKYK